MFKIKQYINNNKQLLIIFFGMLGFLFLHNTAYCDLSFFQKWYQNIENYFLTLTWEKAISDPIELSKSIGWVSVGAIGSLYAFEGIWNIRRLGSIVLYRYTPFGHLDDGSGFVKSWFGFRNTAGPLKNIIDTVPYEEILPLHLARNYVFPYIFIQPQPNRTNFSEITTNTTVTNNSLVIRPNTPEITAISNVEPQIIEREVEKIVHVDHYFEVPVYVKQYVPVVEYRDRENLQTLDNSVQTLNVSAQDLKFSQNNQKTRDDLVAEINLLREHESAVCFTLQKLSRNYETFKLTGATDEQGFSLTPLKLKYLFFPKEESKLIKIYFDDLNFVALSKQSFSVKYPQIFLTLNTLTQIRHEYTGYRFSNDQIFEQYDSYVYFTYNEAHTFFSYSFELDTPNCLIIEKSLQEKKTESYLLSKIEEIQSKNLEVAQNNLDLLVNKLNEKISNEQRLINIETTDQGAQTMDFSINGMFFDEINSYLEIQDQTSFIVASRDGQNLPFNELNEANTQAGIEMMKKYKKTKIVKKQALKEQEALLQAEPLIQEGVDTASSNLFQNMATLFSVVLVGAVVHDPQTVDVLAKTLLGFTHLPEYNQAFLAATHMSIADLQMEYNFGPEEARRAYDAIGQAYDIRHPGSSLSDISSNLSNSNDYLDQAQKMSNSWGWKDYLLFTGGIVIACGTLYYVYQSVKTGTPVENIQNISPNVEVWKNAYFEKINKL